YNGITVCYFAGCMIDRLFPEMGEAAIRVLEACGVRVTYPKKENCCGLIALNSGDRADCARMARQTIVMLEQALAESNADYIVGATTSCVVTLTQDYIRLFEDLQQQGWKQRAQTLAEKVMNFASFVDHVLLENGRKLPVRKINSDNVVVTYHDSCQSINCLGLHSEARHIIQDSLGLELREMPQSDVCCGFGGATSIEHGDVSERIMNNKLNNAESTGATVLVADNPGCLMHLRGGVDIGGRRIRVLHLAQLIADQIE
ncbi:MAG: (Fe-S)-binding protein, partial [Ktedonobacteraceae bacterium]